ncbi:MULTISPECIES: acetyl-CoA C-acetyltransferase [Spongiibacter]|uniref:acetyl-CoA C-acetyltransferase n=1 Tax=Spongiibacter TaxID=630749 RepID=UPI0003B71BCD|nr:MULTISPECIES: acetyl-CoA C-acetyltransferase [Spongiibacter]MAY37654.1 acetyl-CoA acetyltransferase [Spongiibacter sp.]MBI57610.1 acetyl-CoA acetyltransferase [Spongiibacter sp.]MBO6754565.1 acetyl-CoA C-acetyltransferase [Spongiibacter sp.]|tara:strand:+ start:9493 stop:10701 length:1209 start_codon:yes stop_codon:yes gene_type:complete
MSNSAFIYDAVRTPRAKGKMGSPLSQVKPVDLLAGLLNGLRDRHNLDTALVDDVVMGCVMPVGEQGACVAKTAAMKAGWDESVAGVQLDRFCASGLEAVNLAAMKIASGWEELVVAGGVESMSRVPMGSNGGAWGEDPQTAFDTAFVPQGIGADLIATMEGFSRADLDGFAARSQEYAARAREAGYFDRSVLPVKDVNGMTILEKDDFIKPGTTVESLSKLRPSFEMLGGLGFDDIALSKYPQVAKINHVHHAGNSSGIVDGASAVLIGSKAAGEKIGLKARGRVVATAVTGTEPTIMLTGPAPATWKVLEKAGMKIEDIDLFEINEAFASVAMRFQKDTQAPWEKINVNGGAIAMGHPLGATGGMLVGTILDELERRDQRFGLITLCVGGGMGIATIIERL